jgi:hypothetical protein
VELIFTEVNSNFQERKMHQSQILDVQETQDPLVESLLKIQDIENMGKGLFSLEHIPMNELLFKIPQDLIVTRNFMSQTFSSLSEFQALVLTVLKFNKKSDDSKDFFFRKYYQNVQFVKLPMFFSLQVLEFSSKNLQRKIEQQLQNYEKDYQEIKKVYDDDLSYFTHAWSLVNTRCVSLNSNSNVTVGLIPFLDYLNHSCKSQIVPTYKDNGFELWSLQEISKGEQVYLSYGHHDNTFLAAEYGFVEEENQFDYVCIEKELVYSKISIETSEFLDILTRSRIPQDFVIHYQEVCYSLLMTARLAVYLESDTNTTICDVDLSVWEELVRGEREVISQENEEKVNAFIQDICLQVQKSIEKRLNGLWSLKNIQEYKEETDLLERLALQELRIVTSVLSP